MIAEYQISVLSHTPVIETRPVRIPLHTAERSQVTLVLIIKGLIKRAEIPPVEALIMVFIIIFAVP